MPLPHISWDANKTQIVHFLHEIKLGEKVMVLTSWKFYRNLLYYKDKTNETFTRQFHFHYEINCLHVTITYDITVIGKSLIAEAVIGDVVLYVSPEAL